MPLLLGTSLICWRRKDEVAEREENSTDTKRWNRAGKSETLIRITNLMANFLSSLLPHPTIIRGMEMGSISDPSMFSIPIPLAPTVCDEKKCVRTKAQNLFADCP